MTPTDTIHIVSCVDKKYLQHLAVLIISLFENKICSDTIIYHIFHDDLDENDIDKFTAMKKIYPSKIIFHDVSRLSQKYSNIIRYGHVSRAGLYRLSIPEILPDVKKVLYLDCDIIINGDILDLWNVDIKQYPVGAVEDAIPFHRQKNLMMPEDSTYFNSGVLIINVEKWKQLNVTENIVKFMLDFPERRSYNDQDGLNAILHNNWFHLHPKHNQQTALYYLPRKRLVYPKEEYIEARKNPVIIHYTGVIRTTKPWDYIDNHPLKKIYYKYSKLSPWYKFKPTPNGFGEIIVKYYLWLFRFKMKSGIVLKNILKMNAK